MKNKKALAFLLALTMVFASAVPAMAAEGATFADMPANWSKDAMEAAVANGLLTGINQNGQSYLMPSASLTRAQMASIINKAFNTSAKADLSGVTDVKTTDWFYDHMAMAVQMGSFAQADALRPNANITREEVFTVLGKVFKLQTPADTSALNAFADSGNVSSWAAGWICALINEGYIAGSNGMLNPKSNITRAEFAQVMDNIVAQYIKTPGEYTTVATGNIIVQVPGVTLKGVTIDGDLILADGVGTGDITLQDVIVTGALVERTAANVSQLGTTKIGQIIEPTTPDTTTPTSSAVTTTKPAIVGGGGGGGGSSTTTTTKTTPTITIQTSKNEGDTITVNGDVVATITSISTNNANTATTITVEATSTKAALSAAALTFQTTGLANGQTLTIRSGDIEISGQINEVLEAATNGNSLTMDLDKALELFAKLGGENASKAQNIMSNLGNGTNTLTYSISGSNINTVSKTLSLIISGITTPTP